MPVRVTLLKLLFKVVYSVAVSAAINNCSNNTTHSLVAIVILLKSKVKVDTGM